MKNKQVIIRVATVIVSALLIIAAYALIVGDGTIFKGNSDGETLKAKVIRVTDVVATSVNGESEIVTVSFKAQVLGGERRGKTVDVIQEIDKTYAFSPRQVEQNVLHGKLDQRYKHLRMPLQSFLRLTALKP